ncbi:hypothetical protein AA0113_g12093 [Alternaria arborescens]|uniref:Uncharacterized protein n=1 Tax=Alternaria arborescens TaxID=156630 RepID=A0A4Q4PZ76_9PLEO|nr:hypothetical protein AA0113_g12093 [Alternaria arborescens]
MTLSILVALAVCFSVGLILTSVLTYLEVRGLGTSPYNHEYDYRWEKVAEIIVDIISISLGIGGIVAIATVPYSGKEIYYWLDGFLICNLQILNSHNLTLLLRNFLSPRWAIWAVHLIASTTILDIISAVKGRTVLSAYESALLARFAAASLVSLVLSLKQLNVHNNSGAEPRIENYVRLLHTLVLSNAVASLIQLSGAIIVSSLSLAGRDNSAELRRGVFIACTATQQLCHLSFYINRIWRGLIVPTSD